MLNTLVAGDDLVGLLRRHRCQSCPTVSEKLKRYPLETNIMKYVYLS